ncbi:hypothetical protein ACWEQL_35325 [Kitasatospora sp. NPDC004240]
MTKEADTGAGDAHVWQARLGWAFGLTADDPAERAAAPARLAAARRTVQDALDRFNELWHLTRPPAYRPTGERAAPAEAEADA